MTALEHPMQSMQEIFCICGRAMVASKDAIGRVRHRCPACDGVAPPRRSSPDDIARMPQGLVPLQNMLPPIKPGQLRCQGCAKGVEGQARFCTPCHRASKLAYQRVWRASSPKATRTCRGCGTVRESRGGRSTSATCPSCAPVGTRSNRVYKPKACEHSGCGKTFTPSGPRARFCGTCT